MFWQIAALLAAACLALTVWTIGGGALIARLSVFPPRLPFLFTPQSIHAGFEEVSFPSRDGTCLAGWWIPADKPVGLIILCHGMGGSRQDMLPWAELFWKQRYSLLMFDFRAMGKSGGKKSTVGYREVEDLLGALDYLHQIPLAQELAAGVFGFSMGGAVAIRTAAVDSRIKAVAVCGAFASLHRAIYHRCRHHFGMFEKPARLTLQWAGKHFGWFETEPQDVCPEESAAQLKAPLLLLQGALDPVVPPTEGARLLHAAPASLANLHVMPHTAHGRPHPLDREEAERKLLDFYACHLQENYKAGSV